MTGAGFPHSEILGSRFVCQLPEAYRRLPRPSSAPGAKASTLCPYKLQPQKTKMLASTVQFSNNDQDHHQHPPPPPPIHPTQERTSSWSGGPTAPTTPTRPPAHASNPYRRDSPRKHPPQAAVPSGPNSVPHAHPVPTRSPFPPHKRRTRRPAGSRRAVVDVPPMSTTPHTHGAGMAPGQPTLGPTSRMLLRKEVIQPHLPVRLPCYDLVLIASPTFDHSPPYGLGHGLRVLPTFMT